MRGLIDQKTCRENERLIGEEKAEFARSCRRQILASFLGKCLKTISMTIISYNYYQVYTLLTAFSLQCICLIILKLLKKLMVKLLVYIFHNIVICVHTIMFMIVYIMWCIYYVFIYTFIFVYYIFILLFHIHLKKLTIFYIRFNLTVSE